MNVTRGNTIKFVENVFLVLFCNPNAMVLNLDDKMTVQSFGANYDVWFVWRIFYSVVNEIVDKIGNV